MEVSEGRDIVIESFFHGPVQEAWGTCLGQRVPWAAYLLPEAGVFGVKWKIFVVASGGSWLGLLSGVAPGLMLALSNRHFKCTMRDCGHVGIQHFRAAVYRMPTVKCCCVHTCAKDTGREANILLLEFFYIKGNLVIYPAEPSGRN